MSYSKLPIHWCIQESQIMPVSAACLKIMARGEARAARESVICVRVCREEHRHNKSVSKSNILTSFRSVAWFWPILLPRSDQREDCDKLEECSGMSWQETCDFSSSWNTVVLGFFCFLLFSGNKFGSPLHLLDSLRVATRINVEFIYHLPEVIIHTNIQHR
jgi:hypothetical protein